MGTADEAHPGLRASCRLPFRPRLYSAGACVVPESGDSLFLKRLISSLKDSDSESPTLSPLSLPPRFIPRAGRDHTADSGRRCLSGAWRVSRTLQVISKSRRFQSFIFLVSFSLLPNFHPEKSCLPLGLPPRSPFQVRDGLVMPLFQDP